MAHLARQAQDAPATHFLVEVTQASAMGREGCGPGRGLQGPLPALGAATCPWQLNVPLP